MNPVIKTTINVSNHPDYKAITGNNNIKPPIIPFTMHNTAIGPEICSPY